MPDEVLDILDDIFDNGNKIPAKVSNRLLLAAVRKNYRLSADNADAIAGNLSEVKEIIIPHLNAVDEKQVEVIEHQKEHCDRLKAIEDTNDTVGKQLLAIAIAMALVLAVVSYHTGVDFGWLPGF
jgi:hypothetical protein